jgi:hypothetical protein
MRPLVVAVVCAAGIVLGGAGPASAYTYHCASRAHARSISAHNAACATANRVIKAYGTRYVSKRAAGFSCRVLKLDSRSNPIVQCRTGIATIRWTGV